MVGEESEKKLVNTVK